MALPNKPYVGDQTPNQPFYSPEVPATFDRLFGTLVPNIQLDPEPGTAATPWERPADWLAMPTVSATEQKFVGLFPVYNRGGNYLALYFEGNYTVDWGDGTVVNYDSEDIAQHSYTYSNIPANTESSLGYRQVLVTVTPRGGADLTIMDLTVKNDFTRDGSEIDWLDIVVSMPEAGTGPSIRFSGYDYGVGDVNPRKLQIVSVLNAGNMDNFQGMFGSLYGLRSVEIGAVSPSLDNTSLMFANCNNLISVSLFDTSAVTETQYMFGDCNNLISVSLFDLSSATNTEYMFGGCYALTTVPLFDLSSAITTIGMFSNCESLTTVPLFDLSSAVNTEFMFGNCNNLTTVPMFDLSSATNTEYMFGGCYALTTVPLFDTSSVESANSMFSDCRQLTSVPEFDFSSATTMNYMFEGCISLESVTLFDTSSAQNTYGMFSGCESLSTVTLFDTSSVTQMVYMFYECTSLVTLPAFDTSSVTNFDSVVYRCPSLTQAAFVGTEQDIDYRYCYLSRLAIVAIFNGLATASKTIDVRYNPGAAALTSGDRAIATGKGWTVLY